jgi:glyoxylase-like metal-dependent hydrolase (beta-lactamase superfamily II)
MNTMAPVPYELFALRYATRGGHRPEFFLATDVHDEPLSIDYYVWLARRPGHVCLIDTGFSVATGRKRRRELLRDPIEALSLLGTDSSEVQDVVLTHFHYDHAGNVDRLPNARFHVQDREMQYATGRHMAHKVLNASYDPKEVGTLVEKVFQGKVQFHDGDAMLSDGIALHRVGGHTMGMQVVRVFTQRGWVVLASDASLFYEGYLCCQPTRVLFHLGDTMQGYERIRAIAESDDHVVPGHDVRVMQIYAPPSPALDGIAVRLDGPPREPLNLSNDKETT